MSGHVASLFPLILLCFTAHRLFPSAEAIWLSLPASGTKCVSEEIQNNVVVLGDYIVINAHGDGDGDVDHPTSRLSTISSRLTSPYGNTLHSKENETHGHFAFTTSEAGNYVACFWLNDYQEGKQVDLNLEWRTGIAAKDWESVAKKEKIDGVELELRKLEGAVEAIRENLIYLKDREAEMREVSERTNGRVAWFSIMSLGVCIVVSVLQLWHLKSFFRKKKLI